MRDDYEKLYDICLTKLSEELQKEYMSYMHFLTEENISSLPDGYYKNGNKLNYGEVQKLYNNFAQFKNNTYICRIK